MEIEIGTRFLDLLSTSPSHQLAASLPPKAVALFMDLTGAEREKLTRLTSQFVRLSVVDNQLTVTVDFDQLEQIHSRQVKTQRSLKQLKEDFIRAGASHDCMQSLFGLRRRDTQLLRQTLGATEPCGGRPNDHLVDDIVYEWKIADRSGDLGDLHALLEIAKKLKCNVSAVWRATHCPQQSLKADRFERRAG